MTDLAVERSAVAGGLKSVSAALEVLDCFGAHDELGVTDIARRLGVAKSTAHRLLTTLCSRGLVHQSPESGQYQLGLHLYELGHLAVSRLPLRRAAQPLLEELQRRTGHTIHLAVPDGTDVLFVERLASRNGTRLLANVGRRLPAHLTSSGRAIAAFDPAFAEARRAAGFPVMALAVGLNSATWERALEETRRRGVAVTIGAVTTGVSSLAAPVRDHAGRARAAISVIAPSAELDHDMESVARLAGAAAGALARGVCF